MADIGVQFKAFKARIAQMNLAEYGTWFVVAITLLMIVLLYIALTKSI